MSVSRGKEPLRLIRWANDGYPPNDLNDSWEDIVDLIKEIRRLREEVDYLNNKIREIDK